jgi:hypothetical protein
MIGLRLRAVLAVTIATVLYFGVDAAAGLITLAGIALAVEIEVRSADR